MMKKNEKLNKWLWKWHVIAGLIALPFVIILSITGGIYLFKDNYEASEQKVAKQVPVAEKRLNYQEQREIAQKHTNRQLDAMILPSKNDEATQFIAGRFDQELNIFINPYTGHFKGKILEGETAMNKIRNLHGELLMGSYGTKIVELVASWLVVLILTGLCTWWPRNKFRRKGFFTFRTKSGKRTFLRDLHAVSAFWISIFLFMVLLGGLPWTDVFGDYFKWVQQETNTGYPTTWQAQNLSSNPTGNLITLDEIVTTAELLNLFGKTRIDFPKTKKEVYSVSNIPANPRAIEIHHFDQYSGEKIISHSWEDIGLLMQGRLWFMAFHQGQFGSWNKWLMLFTATALFVLSSAAIGSYILRKKRDWGIPKVPGNFKIGWGIIAIIGILASVLPLFGLSVLLIFLFLFVRDRLKNNNL